jgi:hypothetical protein
MRHRGSTSGEVRDDARSEGEAGTTGAARYVLLALVAAVTSAGIWLLMIVDEDRNIGAATLEMAIKFTNLTVVLVGVIAAWIAFGRSPGRARPIAHLTVIVMVVVTALVNATLLDPGLPSGWWGLVDLFQHYLIPVAVVVVWGTQGPPVDVPRADLPWTIAVPFAWLVVVLTRGSWTDRYPYDFLDPSESGRGTVLATVIALTASMLVLALGLSSLDRWRGNRH